MRGDVTVESEPGRGSRFQLSVVVDPIESEHDSAATRGGDADAARALHLLAAEDNPYGRVVLNTMAAALGHRIDFVSTGAAAVEAVRTGVYDAVLMDIVLPDIDGIAATRRIRRLAGRAGTIPVIGLSGCGESEEAKALGAGMTAYLGKPVSPTALSRALATAVGA
jgi:CheY-like chemotaxis protein